MILALAIARVLDRQFNLVPESTPRGGGCNGQGLMALLVPALI